MQWLDNVLKWIDYLAEWVIYVAKIFKTFSSALASIRTNWPTPPVNPFTAKETAGFKDAGNGNDKGSTDQGGDLGTKHKVLDSGIGV